MVNNLKLPLFTDAVNKTDISTYEKIPEILDFLIQYKKSLNIDNDLIEEVYKLQKSIKIILWKKWFKHKTIEKEIKKEQASLEVECFYVDKAIKIIENAWKLKNIDWEDILENSEWIKRDLENISPRILKNLKILKKEFISIINREKKVIVKSKEKNKTSIIEPKENFKKKPKIEEKNLKSRENFKEEKQLRTLGDLDSFMKDCFRKKEENKFLYFLKNNLYSYKADIKLNLIYNFYIYLLSNDKKLLEKEKENLKILFFQINLKNISKDKDLKKWDRLDKYFEWKIDRQNSKLMTKEKTLNILKLQFNLKQIDSFYYLLSAHKDRKIFFSDKNFRVFIEQEIFIKNPDNVDLLLDYSLRQKFVNKCLLWIIIKYYLNLKKIDILIKNFDKLKLIVFKIKVLKYILEFNLYSNYKDFVDKKMKFTKFWEIKKLYEEKIVKLKSDDIIFEKRSEKDLKTEENFEEKKSIKLEKKRQEKIKEINSITNLENLLSFYKKAIYNFRNKFDKKELKYFEAFYDKFVEFDYNWREIKTIKRWIWKFSWEEHDNLKINSNLSNQLKIDFDEWDYISLLRRADELWIWIEQMVKKMVLWLLKWDKDLAKKEINWNDYLDNIIMNNWKIIVVQKYSLDNFLMWEIPTTNIYYFLENFLSNCNLEDFISIYKFDSTTFYQKSVKSSKTWHKALSLYKKALIRLKTEFVKKYPVLFYNWKIAIDKWLENNLETKYNYKKTYVEAYNYILDNLSISNSWFIIKILENESKENIYIVYEKILSKWQFDKLSDELLSFFINNSYEFMDYSNTFISLLEMSNRNIEVSNKVKNYVEINFKNI